MNRSNRFPNMAGLLSSRPHALANMAGSAAFPEVRGQVRFYQTPLGVLVVAELSGLPSPDEPCENPIFGFHIHEGGSCTGNASDPFFNAGGHYNPYTCPHPYHAGDLPPIFGSNGYAFSAFITNRFTVPEILGKALILHARLDDFTSQPGGNAGARMACGEIRRR